MARRRFFGRRGFKRPRRPVKWTGNGLDAEVLRAAGGSDVLTIVSADDYAGGPVAGIVEAGGVTLVRIRGRINLRATIVGGVAFCYIIAHGQTEATFAATAADALTNGDVLWQDHFMVPTSVPMEPIEIDVKSSRKLEQDRVVFVLTAVAQGITYTANFRALLMGAI